MKLRVYQITNKVSPEKCWIAEFGDKQETFFSPPSETREKALSGLLSQMMKVSLGKQANAHTYLNPRELGRSFQYLQ